MKISNSVNQSSMSSLVSGDNESCLSLPKNGHIIGFHILIWYTNTSFVIQFLLELIHFLRFWGDVEKYDLGITFDEPATTVYSVAFLTGSEIEQVSKISSAPEK